MSTCNWLDLQTLGFQPVMPKISPITDVHNVWRCKGRELKHMVFNSAGFRVQKFGQGSWSLIFNGMEMPMPMGIGYIC